MTDEVEVELAREEYKAWINQDQGHAVLKALKESCDKLIVELIGAAKESSDPRVARLAAAYREKERLLICLQKGDLRHV
jgi:hypothetical protein